MDSIQAPAHELQYRAVGIIKGRIERVQKVKGEKRLRYSLTAEGQTYEASTKRYRVSKRLIDGVREGYWMVYPRYIRTDGEEGYRLAWEVASWLDASRVKAEDVGKFSLRGTIVKRDDKTLKLRVRRNEQVDEGGRYLKDLEKRRALTVTVEGSLPKERRLIGWFWDIEVLFEGGTFKLVSGKPICQVDKKPDRKPIQYSLKPKKREPLKQSTKPSKPVLKVEEVPQRDTAKPLESPPENEVTSKKGKEKTKKTEKTKKQDKASSGTPLLQVVAHQRKTS